MNVHSTMRPRCLRHCPSLTEDKEGNLIDCAIKEDNVNIQQVVQIHRSRNQCFKNFKLSIFWKKKQYAVSLITELNQSSYKRFTISVHRNIFYLSI